MDGTFKKQLEECGADVDVTLKRFMGNEAIYMKFIMKFLDDKNYEGIKEGVEGQDYEKAFACAHSLKGVAVNLGLNPVYEASSQITEILRNKKVEEIDLEELGKAKDMLEESYCRFQKIISENKQ